MSSINNEISIINEGKSNIASSLIAKFGVPRENLLNDDGSLKRLTEWNLDGVSQYWADQKVSSTSNKETTPQVAKIGINTEISSSANTVLNVKGDSILTGNITITGNIINDGITAKLSSFLRIDGSNGTGTGVSALINKLSTGSSTPVDADYYISQSVGGGTTGTTYYRRPMSALWKWIYPKTISTSESVSNGGVTISPGSSNEINFGTSAGNLFFGYRKVGNSKIPTNYIFGSEEGTATITSKGFCKAGSTDEYLLTGGGGHIAKSSFLTNSDLLEANLGWGGKNFYDSFGPLDASLVPDLGANRFAFAKPEGITIEYSKDGGATWLDYNASNSQKLALTTNIGTRLVISGSSSVQATVNNQLRIIFDTGKCNIYTQLNKFVIYISTNGSQQCTVSIYKAFQSTPNNYRVVTEDVSIGGWPGYNVINVPEFTTYGNSPASQNGRIKFVFKIKAQSGNYNGLYIYSIMGFGGVGWLTPSTLAKTGCLYKIDTNQSAIFPGTVSANAFYYTPNPSADYILTANGGAVTKKSLVEGYATETYVNNKIGALAFHDTTDTAGALNSTSKLFIIGAKTQSNSPTTFTNSSCYIGTDSCLYSNSKKVLTSSDLTNYPIRTSITTLYPDTFNILTFSSLDSNFIYYGAVSNKTLGINNLVDTDKSSVYWVGNSDSNGGPSYGALFSICSDESFRIRYKSITDNIWSEWKKILTEDSSILNTFNKEAYLQWGGKNQINSSSPIDFTLNPFLSGNKLAALTRSDVSLYRELSTDGTSWARANADADFDKKLFMGDSDYQSQNLTTGGYLQTQAAQASTGKRQVRISALCRKGNDIYAAFSLNKIILSMAASSYAGTDYDYFKLECGKNATDAKGTGATWTTIVRWTPVRGYPGFNTINFNSIQVGIYDSDYNIIRFTFKGGCSCAKILGFGDYANYWRSNYIGLYGRPYTIDHNGLTTFMGGISIPGNLSASGTTNLGTTIIGTSSSTKKLTIYGNIDATGWTKIGSTLNVSGKTTLGSSSTSADLQVYGSINATKNITASAFYESSDKNLKEDITSISAIDLARDIQLKEFRFKADGIKRYGVIAQDLLEEGLDNLVSTKDNHLTVDYISLLCLKIAQLEEEIKKIKMKLL